MTLGADSIAGRQCPYLPERGRSVHVVAVAALHQSFVNPMVIRFAKVCFRGCVAAIAELRLCDRQQVLRRLRVVRGVTVETADVVAIVR